MTSTRDQRHYRLHGQLVPYMSDHSPSHLTTHRIAVTSICLYHHHQRRRSPEPSRSKLLHHSFQTPAPHSPSLQEQLPLQVLSYRRCTIYMATLKTRGGPVFQPCNSPPTASSPRQIHKDTPSLPVFLMNPLQWPSITPQMLPIPRSLDTVNTPVTSHGHTSSQHRLLRFSYPRSILVDHHCHLYLHLHLPRKPEVSTNGILECIFHHCWDKTRLAAHNSFS